MSISRKLLKINQCWRTWLLGSAPDVFVSDLVLLFDTEQPMKTMRIENVMLMFYSLLQHPCFTSVQQSWYNYGSMDPQLCSKLDVMISSQRPLKGLKCGVMFCCTSVHIFQASSSTVCDAAQLSDSSHLFSISSKQINSKLVVIWSWRLLDGNGQGPNFIWINNQTNACYQISHQL